MKFSYAFVVLCFVAVHFLSTADGLVVQDLGGTAWHTYNRNKSISVGAKVPGSIYTDLTVAGVLKGHIYDNFNDLDYRWVSLESWTYERSFDVNADILKQGQVYLTAHGLDTIGKVTLNGHLLGSVENMFVRYKWPIKQFLQPANNSIRVEFESAPLYAKMRHLESLKEEYPIPPECPPAIRQGECYVNYLRKMQASFAWDWGPAFPTQGIWRPISLEGINDLLLRTVSVGTLAKSLKDNHWQLNTTVYLENVALANTNTSTTKVTLQLGSSVLTENQATLHYDKTGEAFVNILVDIPASISVKPWFPNGLGDPNLYDLKVTVSSEHETVSKSLKIGFRIFEISQEQLSVKTKDIVNAFYFKVNNVTMYTKGTNWIPAHVLYEALTDEYLYDMLKSSQLANMNMIRVWGGGFYEDDRFYEIADELGLCVYQDMMFSSSMYPGDDKFMANVAVEIRQQVRRLQYHPSLVIWAGNNENEGNVARPYWAEIKQHWDRYKADYLRLTIDVTMNIVEHEDPSRAFLTSCPSSGVADARKGHLAMPTSLAGDVHHYIGNGNAWDWHRYQSAKFISEYGFQSLSSLNLLEKYISHDQLAYPLTHGLNHRQRCCDRLYVMMNELFHMPKAGGIEAIDDFIYLSQVFQAMSLKLQSEFFRRNRKWNDAGYGFTMGVLIWQLNEIWPSFSWASIEFGGKWKIVHYYIRDFFDNTLLDIYEDHDILKVVIVRDDHVQIEQAFSGTIDVYDWSSQKPIHSEQFHNTTHPFSVNNVHEQNMTSFLSKSKCPNRNQCFITVNASGPNGVTRKNFLLLGKPKDAHWKKSTIKQQVEPEPVAQKDGLNRYTIHLETDHIAPFVWVDIALGSKVEGRFSENGFLLIDKHTITFDTKANITGTELDNLLKIKTITSVHA